MKKRILSTLLVFCMVLSILPSEALAAGTDVEDETPPLLVEETEESGRTEEFQPEEVLPDDPYEAMETPPEVEAGAELYANSDWVTYPVTGGNLYFDPTTGAVADCDENVTGANIPGSINGVPVTSIGNNAFRDCSNLTSITIPASIISIGSYAFSHCSSLTSITIPASVTSIGNNAFFYCSALTSITIPGSVTSIGQDAFYYCSGLTSAGPIGGGYGYEFGWTKKIPSHAFAYCSGLTNITLPDSITSIGDYAFSYCSGLTSVTIPNGVTNIEDYTFFSCNALTSITLPDSVTSIGETAFYGCSKLTSITIPDSVTSIGHYAFEDCSSLTSITLPESVTSIGLNAFVWCNSLTDIYYGGGKTQWQNITIYGGNDPLSQATIHYYYTSPDDTNTFTEVHQLKSWDVYTNTVYFHDGASYLRVSEDAVDLNSLLNCWVTCTLRNSNIGILLVSMEKLETKTETVTKRLKSYDVFTNTVFFHDGTKCFLDEGISPDLNVLLNQWVSCTIHQSPENGIYLIDIRKVEQTELPEGFKITGNITTTCLKKNSISKINAAYYQNGAIDLSMKEFAYALSDNNVLEITAGNWNDETGQQYIVSAKQPGLCTVTFTNLQNGDGISVEFRVIDGDTVYSFDKVPEMTIEKGKTTNFYNHRGLVIDAFNYTENRDTDGNVKDYTVTMTVYNSRNLYGAVSSFYADGKPYEVCVIDKHEPQSTSLVGNLKDLENKIDDLVFLLINNRYYSGESISQENNITITVPAGGYLEISNDASSAAVILANAAGIILEGISVGVDIGTGADKLFSSETEIISAAVKDLLTKDFVNKKVVSTVKEQAVKELVHKKWDFNNCGNCIQAFLGSLSEHGVNIVDKLSEKIVSTTGILSITESVIRAGIPTGPLISFLFDLAKFGNLEVFYANFMESIKSSNGIYIYAPPSNNSYLSNGVNVIPSDDQKDSNTVVHAYRVVDTYDISGNKYETYNISIYRNGQKVQPDSPVTVQIPLPESYNKDTVKVFRINDDGTVSNMNAEIIDGYAVFSTDHFSYYALVSGDENGVFLSRWTSGANATITLSDPEGVLSDALFYAASYDDEGKMLDVAFAAKSVPKIGEVQITFSNPLGEAWEIYVLDSDYAPICPNFTLPNP